MKSAQIKVGDDYVVQKYGDYSPGAWKTWRGLWVDRMRAVSAPKGGKVIMQHIGADGQPEGNGIREIPTRQIHATWEQHLGYIKDAEQARQNYLTQARRVRAGKADRVARANAVLELAGTDMVATLIRTAWSFREEIEEIVQDLADLGYIVSLDPLYITDEHVEEWENNTRSGYFYTVFSPGGVAGVLFGKDEITLTVDELLGVFDAGTESA